MPRAYLDGARMLLFRDPPPKSNRSSPNEDELAHYLFFLNYPRYEAPQPGAPIALHTTLGVVFPGPAEPTGWILSLSSCQAAISTRSTYPGI